MIQSHKFCKAMCAGLVVLALFNGLPVLAAEIHVTNLFDSGAGSLRQAIADAAPGDTTVFDVTGTITLTSGELLINKSLTISGPGADKLAISGGRHSRVFRITGGPTVAISGVTIKDGQSSSSCGWSNGGGGICIEGGSTLMLTDSTVSDNSAWTSGGGILNYYATLTLTNSTVSGNSATHYGGGIYNYYGTATLTNITVSRNSSYWYGAIMNQRGAMSLTNSTVSGNSAYEYGGGIANWVGTLTVTNSTVSNNSAYRYGGGIYSNGTLTLTNSTVSSNSTTYYGGGISISSNTLTLTNSTVSDNSATYYGGGIYNNIGIVTVTSSTLAGNSASYGGGISYVGSSGRLTTKNTILANSPSGRNCYLATGTATSDGYNLSDDSSCAFLTGPGDLPPNTSAGFDDGLRDNGGPTKTVALLATSPAVDWIPVDNCKDAAGNPVATDQRGVVRPQGSKCDIGAFEQQVLPFAAFDAKVEIELGPLANDDEFEVKGTFTLGAGSDGIDPLAEDVILELTGGSGAFSITIPAGSFKFHPAKPGNKGKPEKPAKWTFEGVIAGVVLEAKITDLGGGSFEFKAEGERAELTGMVNPVTVGLTIGNDGGSTPVTAEFE